MASRDVALDEMQWKSSAIAQAMQGVHENSVLHYFANSPFFDPTSNNAILVSQASYNPKMFEVLQTRAAFEARLRTMAGLEFLIAEQPAEMAPGTGTGVWVIRKQTRRKRPGEEDEIAVHATFFVVGENIYTAPTVAEVVGNRLLTVVSRLNSFMTTAGTLPDFSSARGHVYKQAPANDRPKNGESRLSRQASKENTPLPESSQNSKKSVTPGPANGSDYQHNRVLEETINVSLRYGDEYMDEIPITGQPGDFHLSSTGRMEKDRLMVPVPAKGPLHVPNKPTSSVPKPAPLKTNLQAERKGSKAEKSPKTPGLSKPTGSAKLKRKKSKATVTTPAASPTT